MSKIMFRSSDIYSVNIRGGERMGPGSLVLELRLTSPAEWWGLDIVEVTVTTQRHAVAPPAEVDLGAVRARFRMAQLAGTDAEDSGNGWNVAKRNALTRSWNDVAALADEVARLRRELAEHD